MQSACNVADAVLEIEDIASVMTSDRLGQPGHPALAQSAPKMADDAANRGGGKLFIVPHVTEQIEVRDVLIRASGKPIEKSKAERVSQMQGAAMP